MPRSSRRPPRPPTALSEAVDRLTRQATERGWRPATECLSGKVCYPSAAAASAAAYYARGERLRHGKEHYHCRDCGHWHLTSPAILSRRRG